MINELGLAYEVFFRTLIYDGKVGLVTNHFCNASNLECNNGKNTTKNIIIALSIVLCNYTI